MSTLAIVPYILQTELLQVSKSSAFGKTLTKVHVRRDGSLYGPPAFPDGIQALACVFDHPLSCRHSCLKMAS